MNALVAAAESARSLVWDTEVPDIQLLSDGIAAQADALSVIFTILAIILSCVFLVQRLPVPEHDYWASWLTPTLSDVDQERERLKVLSELRAEADKKRRKKTEDLKKQVQLLLREREDLLAKQVLENEEHELQLIEARVRRNCEEEKRVKAEQRRHEKTLPDWKQIERMTSEAKRKQVEANVKEALNRRHELELKKREAELEKKRARLLAMKDEQVRNAFKYSQPEKDIDSLVKEFSDCQKDVITNKVVPVTKKKSKSKKVKVPKKSTAPDSVVELETDKIESEDDADVGNVSQDVSDLLLLASISKPSALQAESAEFAPHKTSMTQVSFEGQIQSVKAELEEYKCSAERLTEDLKQQKAEASYHQATYDQDLARMKRENVMLRQDLTLLKNTNKVLTDSLVQTQSLQKLAPPKENFMSLEDVEKRVEEGVELERMSLQSVFDAAEEEYLHRIKELKTSFTALETRNGAMKSKMKELLQDLDNLRIQDSKNTDWKNKFFTEVAKSETLAKELLQFKELANKLEQDKSQLESTLSSFSHRTMELEAQGNKELTETKSMLESIVQEMERVKTVKASVETLLKESEINLLDLSSEKDILKTSMEHLLKRISALEGEKVSQLTSDTELKKTNLQLTHKISAMEESLEDMHLGNRQEIRIWKQRVDELKDSLGTTKTELQRMKGSQTQIETLESELAHKQVEFAKMQETVNWLTEKNSELEKELSNLFDGQQSESQSDILEITPRKGTMSRAVTKCRYLNSRLLQADLLATEASSKVERLLEATANSAGASSSATLADFDFSPSDLEEKISATFVSLTCSNSRAEKIIAQDKLSDLLKRLYLAHLSQPPSPSGHSSPAMGTRAAPDLMTQ